MSFCAKSSVSASEFDIVRRSLGQAEGLPFANALTAGQIQRAFDQEGIRFGEDENAVYTPAIVFWAMLSQMLLTEEQRSCRSAVIRVASYYASTKNQIFSTNTGAYCRARAKVTEGAVARLTQEVAHSCEKQVPKQWLWKGRRVQLVDGTTFSMPDTPENQAEYPQNTAQEEGLGFPIMRAVALSSLATGMVTAMACGPYAGKETGEPSLLRTIFDALSSDDVLLGDRYYCGWFTLALLQERGVDFVVRMHHQREANFQKGRRLGKKDHVVRWPKPAKPEWMDQETYDRLPADLEVRAVEADVNIPGFRTESLVIVTSLLDAKKYSHSDVAGLYRKRWIAELHLRDIKSTMKLDVLRCKSPAMVRQELWTGLLAYNLIRQSMLQSASEKGRCPHKLSFTATMQMLGNNWVNAAVTLKPDFDATSALVKLRVRQGALHVVGNRPNRIEPFAVKRRPKPHDLLKKPRAQARADRLAGRAA